MTPAAGKDDSGALGRLRAEWVDRVARDPREPADAMALTGYLGASARDDHHRLYLDVGLSSYVDIPSADVLHGQRMQEDSALGEVIVWVRRDARLSYGPTAQASGFFDGSITEQFGGGFPPFTIPPFCLPPTLPPRCFPPLTVQPRCLPPTIPLRGCPPPTFPPRCPPPTWPPLGCPPPRTPVVPCLHTVIDCPVRTPVFPCLTTDPRCQPVRTPVLPCIQFTPACPVQSAVVICQTAICPSAVDACPSAPAGCDTPFNPETPINPAGYFGGGMGGAYGYGG